MTIAEYTHAIGEHTGHGWGFLAAYSLTWLVCAILWRRASARTAAYGTLFQGMVALPVALALTELTAGPERPVLEGMETLSILLASGQLLALPLVIYLVARRRYTLVPLAMAIILVVHFAPYSWLYATPLYLVMGGAVAIGVVVAMNVAGRGKGSEEAREVARAGATSLTVGATLAVCAVAASLL